MIKRIITTLIILLSLCANVRASTLTPLTNYPQPRELVEADKVYTDTVIIQSNFDALNMDKVEVTGTNSFTGDNAFIGDVSFSTGAVSFSSIPDFINGMYVNGILFCNNVLELTNITRLDVGTVRLNGAEITTTAGDLELTPIGNINANNKLINLVGTPVVNGDATNKGYVDALVTNVTIGVTAITNANITGGNASLATADIDGGTIDGATLGSGVSLTSTRSDIYISASENLSTTGVGDPASLLKETTYMTSTGAHGVTLADGVEGQTKNLIFVVDAGDITMTPANMFNGTSITFDDPGESVVLKFHGTTWYIVSAYGTITVNP